MFKELIGVDLTEKEYYDTAIVDYHDKKSRFFTYKDLSDSAKKIAEWLISQGLPSGSKIPIMAKNSFEYVSVFFGIRLASMIPILVNNKLPESYLKTILEENSVDIIFCDSDSAEKVKEKKIILLSETKQLISEEYQDFIFSIDKKAPAFILYTSGSSGIPKGVLISNEARIWTVKTLKSVDQFKRKFILPNPLFHMNGISVLEVNLGSHETTVLLPYFDVDIFLSMSKKHRAFAWTLVTPMMAMIMARRDLLDNFPRNRIVSISLGSSPVSEKLFYLVKNEFNNAVIVIRYGLSEVGASIFREHADNIKTPDMSVGYPRKGIEYKLVDDVLWLKSPGMLTSYLNNENRLDSEGFFNTKDKFKIDEQGFYYFIGREDDMFVCGGDNIYPLEIEKIINSHPDVENSSVIGIDDDIKGKKPFAFVKLKNHSTLNKDVLRDFFLKNHTINHCPREFYIIDNFPLTGTGKIDKEELKKMIENKNHV